MEFDEDGNILLPVTRDSRMVLTCPRTGEIYEPKPDQTIVLSMMAQQPELYKYQELIRTAPYDQAGLKEIGEPCKTCRITLYTILRVGTNEKMFKVCANGHLKT